MRQAEGRVEMKARRFSKLFAAAATSALYLAVLCVIYFVHVNYFRVGVVLYSAVADVFLATAAVGTLVFLLRSFNPLGVFEKFLLVVIWLLAGYSLAITLPTVVDRSLSLYILEKIEKRGGIALSGMKDLISRDYIGEYRVVDTRLYEQLRSGTITIIDGCVILTPLGRRVASWSSFFRRHLLPDSGRPLETDVGGLTVAASDGADQPRDSCGSEAGP